MHIYLIRHAHAEDGAKDALRPLSKKGLKQIRAVGRWLRKAEILEADEFWHSPLVRARDTAELLAEQVQSDATLVEVSGLKPTDDPQAIARRLGDLRRPVALVGHDPHLSALASLLVTGKVEPVRFRLRKCAVLRLERSSGGWIVQWQVSPDLL